MLALKKQVAYHANKSIELLPFFLLITDVMTHLFSQSSCKMIFWAFFPVHFWLISVYCLWKGDWKMKPEAMLSLSNVAFPTVDARCYCTATRVYYCRLKVNNNKSSLISPPSVFSLWYYRGHSPGIFLKAEPRVLTFLLHTLEALEELTCQFDIQKGAKFKCQEFSLAA